MLAFYDVWVQDLKFACEYLQALKAKGFLEVIRKVTLFLYETMLRLQLVLSPVVV